MAGAVKIHLHSTLISSKSVKQFFESVKVILENVKTFLFVVNKSISYLLFRVYSMVQLMINTATTVTAARMEGLNLVSKETLTRKRNEARAARERARVLQADAAEKRVEAEWLQREEERLGAQADDLDKEVVDMEWQEPRLERRIADIEKTIA